MPKTNKGTGLRKRIFGTMVVVNLNAKKGYRVSPGVNWRAREIQRCATGQSLSNRKQCFKTGGGVFGAATKKKSMRAAARRG